LFIFIIKIKQKSILGNVFKMRQLNEQILVCCELLVSKVSNNKIKMKFLFVLFCLIGLALGAPQFFGGAGAQAGAQAGSFGYLTFLYFCDC
jgi:hypothetical protein